MNKQARICLLSRWGATTIAAVVLAACSSAPIKDPATERARAALTELQSNPQLTGRAPIAMQEAEAAVAAAEAKQPDAEAAAHTGYVAERKVEAARQEAMARLAEDQVKTLAQQRDQVVLDARTAEADRAKAELEMMRQQMSQLNARQTDRGVVLTLGDVLFSTGKADLKPGASGNLSKLVGFLNQNKDRQIIIEGHTDSVGSEASNTALSQRRADAVKIYLVGQGIDSGRITTTGLGETAPVASNKNAAGRQLNRRVEIVISKPVSPPGMGPGMGSPPGGTMPGTRPSLPGG